MTDAAPVPMPPMAPAASDGKTLGVVAFVVVFFFSLLGVILGFVAKGQSKRAGVKNTLATAAIVLGFVFMALTVILVFAIAVPLLTQCAQYGPGVHELSNGVTLTCG
jgi:uncharacterized membrane protein